MKRKEYIDWLNEQIEEGIKRKDLVPEEIGILDIELSIFRLCLNRFKGR